MGRRSFDVLDMAQLRACAANANPLTLEERA
jgi:hypothetical protein